MGRFCLYENRSEAHEANEELTQSSKTALRNYNQIWILFLRPFSAHSSVSSGCSAALSQWVIALADYLVCKLLQDVTWSQVLIVSEVVMSEPFSAHPCSNTRQPPRSQWHSTDTKLSASGLHNWICKIPSAGGRALRPVGMDPFMNSELAAESNYMTDMSRVIEFLWGLVCSFINWDRECLSQGVIFWQPDVRHVREESTAQPRSLVISWFYKASFMVPVLTLVCITRHSFTFITLHPNKVNTFPRLSLKLNL